MAKHTSQAVRRCLMAFAAVLVGFSAWSEDSLVVPENTTYTLPASATYGTNDIRGTLVVPSGLSVSAYDNWLGRTGSAVLDIQGGTFGTSVSSGSTPHRAVIGEEGGTVAINLTAKSSVFRCGDFTISASAAAQDSGFVDVLTCSASGNTSLSAHHRYNKSAYTARIRVLSGKIIDTADGIGYYDSRFQKGSPWLIEIAKDATYQFSRGYRSGPMAPSGASLTVKGEGLVEFVVMGGDGSWAVNSGVVFENAGGITFFEGNKPTAFASGVVFADTFGTMTHKYAQAVTFGGDVNLGSMGVTSTGRFQAASGKSPTITFGTADRDATLTGEVFAEDCGLKLVKTGAGTLTTSATTPFLPELKLDAGALVIKGALFCSNLTAAAGTSITVDGGTWTIEGDQLAQAVGSTVATLNSGRIIVKKVGDKVPAFAPGTTVKLAQYWIDGERQANGIYTVGDVTFDVFEFADPAEIWTNAEKPGDVFGFPFRAEYKGFSLVKTDAPLTFTGGPVMLGTAGIAVEDTDDETTFMFDLPLYAPIDQTWAFGKASAVFSRPFTMFGSESGKVTITSDKDIVLATTNSTFDGTFAITAHKIFVSGKNPFGVGTGTVTITADASLGTDRRIELRDVECTQQVNLDCSSGGNTSDHVFFEGTNSMQSAYWGDSGRNGAKFGANSLTVWNGNVEDYNYSRFMVDSGARIVYKKPVKMWGYAASKSYNMLPAASAKRRPSLRFEAQNTVETDAYPVNLYGNSRDYPAGLRVELAADHAFSRGTFLVQELVEIDLCGYDQGMSKITGTGTIRSDAPAFLELNAAAETTNEVQCAFADKAGFRMVGAGLARLTGASSSAGGIAVGSGTVELATAWTNATSVTVSAGGKLVVEANRAVAKTASMSLAGVGALAVRSPSGVIKVASLALTNPTTGETTSYTTGDFNASNSWGLVSEGTVQVGARGLLLIVR